MFFSEAYECRRHECWYFIIRLFSISISIYNEPAARQGELWWWWQYIIHTSRGCGSTWKNYNTIQMVVSKVLSEAGSFCLCCIIWQSSFWVGCILYTLLEISFSAVQKSVDLEPVCTNATYDLTESIKQEFAKVLLCPKLGLDWSYVM